jgi:hypothetical protein
MPVTADDNHRNSRYHGIAQIRGPITDPANSEKADPDERTRVHAITDVRVARVETAPMSDANTATPSKSNPAISVRWA